MTTYRHAPIRTSTGILIGGAYVPPPAPMSTDAEAVQALLLAEADRRADRLVIGTCLLALVALVVIAVLS
jgi:hypothetical protein